MIADGRHLPTTLMRLALKCIPPERLCLVSDALPGAGLPEGTGLDVGGLPAEISNGVAILVDGTSLAGSTTLLGRMVAIVREDAGADLADAIRTTSLTPAQIAGVADRVGSLEAGKTADVVIYGDDMRPWRTMLDGRWIEASVVAPASGAASISVAS
jgi:N-acetylglucosamine-6-phosphate deacetylase